MRRPSSSPPNPVLFAKNKIMDLFARRDYSEKEVRLKLRASFNGLFDGILEVEPTQIEAAIDEAVEFARTKGWLKDPVTLAEKMAATLHRRKKGIEYINQFLQDKGLPEVKEDRDLELEKALALVKNRFSGLADLKFEEKSKEQARMARFLAARGFDSEIVRKVIYEEL